MSQRSGPLAGIRVVELSGLGPAPFAAMILADLGADVLRIERPDPSRLIPETGPPEDVVDTNPYDLLGRSRRTVAIDLRRAEGAALVRELVGSADVFIEGFRPGVAERFGLGPDDLHAVNDRLVYGRMTGWGQTGPLADRAGHDLTYLAVSGLLAHIGRAGQPPTPPLNLVADFGGGAMFLVTGVLAALVERGVSGHGQTVDAAMVDGAAALMAPLFGAWASGFWSADRGTNLLDSGAPFYDCYECADGGWIAIGAIEGPFYAQLLDGLGLAGDETLPDQHDQSRWGELRERISGVVAGRTRDDWAEIFAGTDACVAPVLSMGEAPSHPHAVAREAFVDVDGVFQPAPAPRFDRTPTSDPEPTPVVSDPVATLGDWGIAVGDVDRLVAAGVVA